MTKTVDFDFSAVLESTKSNLEQNNVEMAAAIRANSSKIEFIDELLNFFKSNNLTVKKTEELEKVVESAKPTPVKEVKVAEPKKPAAAPKKKEVNF